MSTIDTWSFGAIVFKRQIAGDEPAYFPRELQRTVDEIAATGERIVDEGATVYEPLGFVALCDTQAVATSLETAYGTKAILTSPTGRARRAQLVRADPLVADGGFFRLQVLFEPLS